ncbi:LxmA leader domain family RiPP [Streptosporangium sp. NPDC000396]|uniref:LxmA leader domain family RiPP n=1 Tax=Streptosporangium sp. NPDC000396 TaxID=3366185 RepID=UPI00369B64B2
MRKNDAITELVAGYNTYVGAEDLSVSAATAAPATTPICVKTTFSVVSDINTIVTR